LSIISFNLHTVIKKILLQALWGSVLIITHDLGQSKTTQRFMKQTNIFSTEKNTKAAFEACHSYVSPMDGLAHDV